MAGCDISSLMVATAYPEMNLIPSLELMILLDGAGGREMLFEEFQDGFSAGAHMQFFVNMMQMCIYSGYANGKMFANFLAGIAFAKRVKNFLFTLRKLFAFARVGRGFAEGLNDADSDLTAHGCAALVYFLDGAKNVGRVGTFQQIAAGASFERAKDTLIVFIDGQNEYPHGGADFFEFAGAVHAGQVGQMNIHQYDVRLEPGDQLERILRRIAVADAMVAGSFVQVICQLFAKTTVIFNNGNIDSHIQII